MTESVVSNFAISMPPQLLALVRSFKSFPNGLIYIGKIDSDPSNPENQLQVYHRNGDNIPVPQPIMINDDGYPVYNGQVSTFTIVDNYSMTVHDSDGTQQLYIPNALRYATDKLNHRLSNTDLPISVGNLEHDNLFSPIVDQLNEIAVNFVSVEALKASISSMLAVRITDSLRGGVYFQVNEFSSLVPWEINALGDIFITNAGGYRYIRDLSDGVRPEWFGAQSAYLNSSGDWINDNFDNATAFNTALQAILDAHGDNFGSRLTPLTLKVSACYSFASQVNLDSNISINGNGATLFPVEGFNTSVDNPKVLARSFSRKAHLMSEGVYSNIYWLGAPPRTFSSTKNAGITAIQHDGIVTGNAHQLYNARSVWRDCIFRGFYRAERMANRAYLIKHFNCRFISNNNHILVEFGSDSGENISYNSCLFSDGGEVVVNAGKVTLESCSVDYTRAGVTVGQTGTIVMLGGHIENSVTDVKTPFVTCKGSGKFLATGTSFWVGGTAPNESIECLFKGDGWMTRIQLQSCDISNTLFYKNVYSGFGDFDAPSSYPGTRSQARNMVILGSRANFASEFNQRSNPGLPRSYIARFATHDFSNSSYVFTFASDPLFDSGKCLLIKKISTSNPYERIALIFHTMGRINPSFNFSTYSTAKFNIPDIAFGYSGEVIAHSSSNAKYSSVIGAYYDSWHFGSMPSSTTIRQFGMFGTSMDFINGNEAPRTRLKKGMTHCYLRLALHNMAIGDELRIGDINLFIM